MRNDPKERRRPYDTSEPNSLDDVISQLLTARGYGRVQSDRQLHDIWKAVVGDEVAEETRVMSVRNGILNVGVSNSALMNELSAFRKTEFLDALKADYAHLKIRDIRFKLRGSMNS